MKRLLTILALALLIAGCTGPSGDSSGTSSVSGYSGNAPAVNSGIIDNPITLVSLPSAPGDSGASGSAGGSEDSSSGTPSSNSVHNPEPNTIALLGLGLAGLIAASLARRRKK